MRRAVLRPSTLRTLVLSLLALAIAGLPAAAQEEAAEAAEAAETPIDVFGEVIDVRVVNVEVVVTDRDGNRVTGLGPQDFRLLVDGKEVAVDYFSEILGGEAQGAAPGVPGVPAAAEGEVVGTSYLVFVDDYLSVVRDRNKVLEGMEDSLAFLRPGDRLAVVAFDGERVEMLTSWTDSERDIRRALSDARARPSRGLIQLAELRAHDSGRNQLPLAGLGRSGGATALFDLSHEDRFFAQQFAHKVERAVSGAVAALRGFAKPPGRKVMLLLSGGWPFSPASYAASQLTFVRDAQVAEGVDLYAPLVDTANLLGYTIYPVDVPGLQGVGAVVGPHAREQTVEDTLTHLAGETGGQPLINARRLAPLEHAANDTRSYYWLGFSPQRRQDDRRHAIEVKVVRPGLRARGRDSFLDLSVDAERQMAVESALLFGDPAADGGLMAQVGASRNAGRRAMEVPLRIAFPLSALSPIALGDGDWVVRADLRVAALDDRMRRSDVPAVALQFRLDEAPKEGAMIPFETTVKLRRIDQVLVLSLTDPVSGRSLTARVPVSP
jgi:VWFA-related protein